MIEKIEHLPIHGNEVEDANVEESLEELLDKLNEVILEVNRLRLQVDHIYPRIGK